MTSTTPSISHQPISTSRATSTRQSPDTVTHIGPPDREAWIRHYEWEGAELPEECLACCHQRAANATASAGKPG